MIDVNTTNSLVNGSLGVIEDIITDNNERVELIIVRLKGEKAGSQQKEKYWIFDLSELNARQGSKKLFLQSDILLQNTFFTS